MKNVVYVYPNRVPNYFVDIRCNHVSETHTAILTPVYTLRCALITPHTLRPFFTMVRPEAPPVAPDLRKITLSVARKTLEAKYGCDKAYLDTLGRWEIINLVKLINPK